MGRFFRYVETHSGREKFVKAIYAFIMLGGAIVTIILLTAAYLGYR